MEVTTAAEIADYLHKGSLGVQLAQEHKMFPLIPGGLRM